MSKWKIFTVSLVLLALLVTLVTGCDTETEPSNSSNNETTKEYTLTIEINPAGGGTTSPEVGTYDYDDGTEVDITATTADGYVFDHWSGVPVPEEYTNPVTITMDSNKTVTANFALAYDLAVNVDPAEAGVVTLSEDGPYKVATEVTLTATPADRYEFDHWSGVPVPEEYTSPVTITMDSNKTVTAHFVPVMYTLTVEADYSYGGNEVEISQPGPYETGTEVILTAIPADGYVFSQWGGAATGHTPTVTITMNADETVTAHFTPTVMYDLTVIVVPSYGGTVDIKTPTDTYTTPTSVTLNYAPGTEVTLIVKPSLGNSFDYWAGDLTGGENPATIIMNSDKEITAVMDCG